VKGLLQQRFQPGIAGADAVVVHRFFQRRFIAGQKHAFRVRRKTRPPVPFFFLITSSWTKSGQQPTMALYSEAIASHPLYIHCRYKDKKRVLSRKRFLEGFL